MTSIKNLIHRLPSPALVISMVALVAALGGTAVALPGKNKIDRNDLRRGAVGPKAIKAESIGADKLAAGSVGNTEIADGSVSKSKLASNALPNVVAFGRVNNPDPGNPTLSNAVGITSVSQQSGANEGSTRVTVSPDAIPGPGSNVSACTIQTTIALPANGNASLGLASVVAATGAVNGIAQNQVQVQTRDGAGGIADQDYWIQVVCQPV